MRQLGDDDWDRPTVAGVWRVRDIVGHLLDIDLRTLSGGRDRHRLVARGRSLSSFSDVVGFINELNAEGISYTARLSPRVMTDLLDVAGRGVSAYVASLPPHEDAWIPVAWADEDRSANWMNIGRDYTEHWHHQMQIRDAVGAPPLLQRQWIEPLLDLSVRALRRAYKIAEIRDGKESGFGNTDCLPSRLLVSAPVGTAVVFQVDIEGNIDSLLAWSVIRDESGWTVMRGQPSDVAACLRTDADTAWKLLYNALSPEAARARVAITGDAALVEPMLNARSVMV